MNARRLALARVTIAVLIILLIVCACTIFLRPGKDEILTSGRSAPPELLAAARWKSDELQQLVEQFPHDFECKYWLALALMDSHKSTADLLESAALLDSIPDHAEPTWLNSWKHRQLTRLSITLLEDQHRRSYDDPFQHQLIQRLQQATRNLNTYSGEQIRSDLTQLRDLLHSRWAYFADKPLQTELTIDAAFENRLAEIEPEMTVADGVQLLERFISDMSDGHSYLANYPLERMGLPAQLRLTTNGIVVEAVHLSCADLQKGDILDAINGNPIDTWLTWQMGITSCSTPAARPANAVRNMSLRLVCERNTSPPTSVDLTVVRNETSQSIRCNLIPEHAWQSADPRPWFSAQQLTDYIGYIRISTWAPQAVDTASPAAQALRSEIDKAMASLIGSQSIVIDLRGNLGGYDWLCTWLASHFISSPFPIYSLQFRAEGGEFLNPEMHPAVCGESYPAHQGEIFNGAVYVLIDEMCFSATDTFLYVLSANLSDRLTIIGRPNAAGIGGPAQIDQLKHTGMTVTLSQCKAFDSEGKNLLEGHPVHVHHHVEWTQQDVLVGRDPDLEKALDLIRLQH